jgi:hypothetical protein
MSRSERIALCGLVVLLGAGVAKSDPVTVQCPETLDVTQTAAATGDWQVYASSATHAFSRLKIYNGHPQGKVVLGPNNAEEQPANYRWTLGDAGDNLWVECSYHGSTTRLVHQLAKGLHSCQSEKLDNTMGLSCQ